MILKHLFKEAATISGTGLGLFTNNLVSSVYRLLSVRKYPEVFVSKFLLIIDCNSTALKRLFYSIANCSLIISGYYFLLTSKNKVSVPIPVNIPKPFAIFEVGFVRF